MRTQRDCAMRHSENRPSYRFACGHMFAGPTSKFSLNGSNFAFVSNALFFKLRTLSRWLEDWRFPWIGDYF
ncbi:hypothetical protein MES4922_190266 [Mesorhizobium ventifaucium]|uniref:Uncharacterized protein n=1 Tax=Mesorhizobium ventifaucium TaxID=666020 RepID=A0ABN8JNT2_9HYPH|nr:hypothetical protein MES4922_190266 [Mesorhizobium ventifaucium]